MANQEQLDLLKQGSDVWNTWRNQHASLRPDLSGANLTRAYLKYAHLGGADLSGADLSGANLTRAHLKEADLKKTDLSGGIAQEVRLSRREENLTILLCSAMIAAVTRSILLHLFFLKSAVLTDL